MSNSIEDILRAHGIGSSGGVQLVKLPDEPKTGLSEGLFWYNTSNAQLKVYLDGAFRSMGGGGSVLTPFFGQTSISTTTDTVAITVSNYNPAQDLLLVTQNGTPITETLDFTIDRQAKTIKKKAGLWKNPTVFGFTVLAMTATGVSDNLMLARLEDHVKVAAGISRISFTIPAFNPLTDLLTVHQKNLKIFKDIDYTIDPSGSSIMLNYTPDEPEEFHFSVLKKIRDQFPEGSVDGHLIIDDSVTKRKLSPELRNEIDSKEVLLSLEYQRVRYI